MPPLTKTDPKQNVVHKCTGCGELFAGKPPDFCCVCGEETLLPQCKLHSAMAEFLSGETCETCAQPVRILSVAKGSEQQPGIGVRCGKCGAFQPFPEAMDVCPKCKRGILHFWCPTHSPADGPLDALFCTACAESARPKIPPPPIKPITTPVRKIEKKDPPRPRFFRKFLAVSLILIAVFLYSTPNLSDLKQLLYGPQSPALPVEAAPPDQPAAVSNQPDKEKAPAIPSATPSANPQTPKPQTVSPPQPAKREFRNETPPAPTKDIAAISEDEKLLLKVYKFFEDDQHEPLLNAIASRPARPDSEPYAQALLVSAASLLNNNQEREADEMIQQAYRIWPGLLPRDRTIFSNNFREILNARGTPK
ncbi:hypothetical protein BH09SUM1_BH09SUM1_09690 [soil metagenome]